jgi:uncharacterized membrane protein
MAAEHHIKNPFEMVVEEMGSVFGDIERALAPRARPAADQAAPVVRKIQPRDLADALREGLGDLGSTRADVLFIGLIYAVAGLVAARAAFHYDLLPLLFPMVSGFALVGPVAALGLYEISRRRELGEPVGWASGFGVLRSPALPSILMVGAILLALFFAWMLAAWAIYAATLGPEPPASLSAFAGEVFGTPAGWALIVVGVGVGFLFAAAAFAISVVSLPLLLDRPMGAYAAIGASFRAVSANLPVMALWGMIVVGALVLGAIPALLGLIIVIPVLGHATWRLYRKLIAPADRAA